MLLVAGRPQEQQAQFPRLQQQQRHQETREERIMDPPCFVVAAKENKVGAQGTAQTTGDKVDERLEPMVVGWDG